MFNKWFYAAGKAFDYLVLAIIFGVLIAYGVVGIFFESIHRQLKQHE